MPLAPHLVPKVLPPSDAQGRTALHWAASRDDLAGISAALQQGVPIDATTVQGWTPLHFAVNARALRAVQALLQRGADANRANARGRTPLMLLASAWKNIPSGEPVLEQGLLDALLAGGANVNATPLPQDDDGPHSLLHAMAVHDQDRMLAEVMARRGLQLQDGPLGCFSVEEEMIFNPGTAPAFTEIFLRTPGFVERLVGRYDTSGNNVLHHLVRATERPTDSWRDLASGMLLDLPNNNGATPLHVATWNNKPEWQAMLLELGADPERLDATGRMAWPEAVAVAHELDQAPATGGPTPTSPTSLPPFPEGLPPTLSSNSENPGLDDLAVTLDHLKAALNDPGLSTPDIDRIRGVLTRTQAALSRRSSDQPLGLPRPAVSSSESSLAPGEAIQTDPEVPAAVSLLAHRRFPVFNQAPRWTDQDVKQKRFAHFEQGLPCWIPALNPWTWQESMDADFPWMKEVTARLVRWLVVKQHQGLVVTWPSLMLWGPSGSGKTLYWKTAFERLGQPRLMLSMGGTNDSAMIRGTGKGWANAEPGLALNVLNVKGVINPVIVLDDLDRVVGSDSNGNAHEALQPLLDRSSARHYLDNFLNMEVDVARLSWVGTITDEERLPKALRDRLQMVEVKGPDYGNPKHFEAVLATAERLAREQWGFDQPTQGPRLSAEALVGLKKVRWTSLRSFAKSVEELLGESLYHDALESTSMPHPTSRASSWREASA